MNPCFAQLQENIGEILADEGALASRIAELAEEITADYTRMGADDLLIVGILRGSVVFLSDLIRKLQLPLQIDFLAVSSYGDAAVSSGNVQLQKDIEADIRGRHVLIVEDIVDTGNTLAAVRDLLLARGPASLRFCTLLDKPSRREVEMTVDYTGFVIPDAFVVGCGMDHGGNYRQFPFVGILKPEVYQ